MQIPCQEWTMLDLLPKGKISFRGFWEEKMLFRLVFSFAFATWTLTFQAKRNITTSPKRCRYMTFPRCRRFVLGILVKIGKVDEVNDVEPIRVPIASGTRAGDYWKSDGFCGLPRHNVAKICRIKISHHIKEFRTTYKYFQRIPYMIQTFMVCFTDWTVNNIYISCHGWTLPRYSFIGLMQVRPGLFGVCVCA